MQQTIEHPVDLDQEEIRGIFMDNLQRSLVGGKKSPLKNMVPLANTVLRPQLLDAEGAEYLQMLFKRYPNQVYTISQILVSAIQETMELPGLSISVDEKDPNFMKIAAAFDKQALLECFYYASVPQQKSNGGFDDLKKIAKKTLRSLRSFLQ